VIRPIALAVAVVCVIAAAIAGAGALLSACKHGAGEEVRPSMPHYLDAGTGDCVEPGETASPLLVDVEPTERVDLEVALREGDGVVAVELTCKSGLRLLPSCKAPGAYAFKGATLKEQVVSFQTSDELRANLPSLGAALPKLSAEMARGATLDVALAMIGKLRASRPVIGRDDLEGDCGGATHFIRGATIGAFAMKQGSRGQVKAAASMFAEVSDDSSASKSVDQHDGKRAACQQSGPKATEAPENCGAVLRLELRALVAGKADPEKVAAPPIEVEGCPDGFVFDAGKCRAALPGEGKQCRWGDERDCRAQCSAGHPGSCAYVGSILMERDQLAEAAPFFQKSCQPGVDIPLACHNLAFAHYLGAGVAENFARAMALFTEVCNGGTAVGCAGVALLHYEGKGVPKDVATAVKFYEQACSGGDQEYGCPLLGRLYLSGEGVPKDPAKARAMFQTACAAGSRNGCLLLKQP
jgi:hypothetical protein